MKSKILISVLLLSTIIFLTTEFFGNENYNHTISKRYNEEAKRIEYIYKKG